MKQNIKYLLSIIIILSVHFCYGQQTPFNKGINLTNWFQASSAQEIQFSKYSRDDLEQIKSLGCDVIRLPINLHSMTTGNSDHTIDPLFYSFLDEVIDWTEALNIHLILDNHSFDTTTDTDPNIGNILTKVWPQMAEHYKNRSDKIYFEILNEPHGISDTLWNSIQQDAISAIREIDTKHTIIVGPAGYNSYNNLDKMPEYTDDNLIYTFHFYDPFLFTHQGASWTGMTDLIGIPFPYAKEKMPEFPESMKSHWSYGAYKEYNKKGNLNEVHRLIDIAVAFQKKRNVPIYCGEFGVFNVASPDSDRTYWYGVVRKYLEQQNIGWTTWDYHGGFGLFTKDGNDIFEHDLNISLIKNLGMTVPEQTPFSIEPETESFIIYDDYTGKNIKNSTSDNGFISFYSEEQANNGNYCIEWSGASQYDYISFDFSPDKDFSFLANNNYALDFFIRSDDLNGSLDFRFVDTKTDTKDHPWRNRITIDNTMIEWNNEWQHLHIPLTEFAEQGAWDSDAWYTPSGLFDWSAIDKMEIVNESADMSDGTIFIDNIFVTNMDTAKVNSTNEITYTPSPDNNTTTIRYNNKTKRIYLKSDYQQTSYYRISDTKGTNWFKGQFSFEKELETQQLPRGMYIVEIYGGQNKPIIQRIIVM